MEDFLVVQNPDGHDLEEFRELNEAKVSWDQRVQVIKRRFPSVDRLDWNKAFLADPTLFGRVVNDILKVDAAQPGKPGKRPAIEQKDAEQRLKQLMGEDYTTVRFAEMFPLLCGKRSVRAIASKTGLNRNTVYYLLKGGQPSAEAMEKIAKAFRKKPEFFYEYRMLYISAVLWQRLDSNPEATINLYRKVRFQEGEF
jgi:transcriptional regulator with XRE-family HTH domain